MRAWIVSDLHFTPMDHIWGPSLNIPQADVCICAGDVSNSIGTSISYLIDRVAPRMPVVFVLGNHDYYGSSVNFALENARKRAAGTGVHILENQSIEIGGCRFVGSTLWTDFAVPVGGDDHVPPEERRAIAFALVPSRVADFHSIYRSDERRTDENGMITAREIVQRHYESRAFIDNELSQPFDGATVVVTHHAPHIDSFSARYFGDVTNAAFASDLSDLIARRRPSMWIHGHIHSARDYIADSTRIICNPRGYGNERNATGFRDGFVVDL